MDCLALASLARTLFKAGRHGRLHFSGSCRIVQPIAETFSDLPVIHCNVARTPPAMHCTSLHCIALQRDALQVVAVHCTSLHRIACNAVHCMQCGATMQRQDSPIEMRGALPNLGRASLIILCQGSGPTPS